MWERPTPPEYEQLHKSFQRSARHRGKLPDDVLIRRAPDHSIILSAMLYKEPGKWDRWGLQTHPGVDLEMSWSEMMIWVRSLIGSERSAIEVYPKREAIVNGAPIRWFWVMPGEIPNEFNLNSR